MKEEAYISELLALVARLTDRYTSMESSSVSYETAQMLMEAVLYTLEHDKKAEDFHPVSFDVSSAISSNAFSNTSFDTESYRNTLIQIEDTNELSLAERYEIGYQNILDKALHAKQWYEQLLPHLDTYGCQHYYDTLCRGMKEFFRRYDARFQPQNALILFDYPLLKWDHSLQGIDLIFDYLYKISLENELLSWYPKYAVTDLLKQTCPGYTQRFMDNVCELVLHTSFYCAAARKPIRELALDRYEENKIRDMFTQMPQENRKAFVTEFMNQLFTSLPNSAMQQYFLSAVDHLAGNLTRRFSVDDM